MLLAGVLALTVEEDRCPLPEGFGRIDGRYGVLQLFSGSDKTVHVAALRRAEDASGFHSVITNETLVGFALAFAFAACVSGWAYSLCWTKRRATKKVAGMSFELVDGERLHVLRNIDDVEQRR